MKFSSLDNQSTGYEDFSVKKLQGPIGKPSDTDILLGLQLRASPPRSSEYSHWHNKDVNTSNYTYLSICL